jgi:hypothetical protein
MTPNFIVFGIQTPGWSCPRLWLPVFLLWIPVVALSPLIFLALVAAAIAARTNIWKLIALFWKLLSSLTGTHVQVCAEGTDILIRIL